VQDSASTSLIKVDSAGSVIIANSSAVAQKRGLSISTGNDGTGTGGIYILSGSAAGGDGATVEAVGRRSDGNTSRCFSGTIALAHFRTDATSANGQVLGSVVFGGNASGTTAASVIYSASIIGVADGTWSSNSAMPTALAFYTGSTGTALITANANTGTERMRIDSSGNVGIGTASPTAKLDVNGSIKHDNQYEAGKNKIINGDFGIWQRGTSITCTSGNDTFAADRFLVNWTGTGTTTASQQTFTPGTAPVAGYEGTYFHRLTLGAGASYFLTAQKIEDVRTFAGQTITVSYWAKASSSVVIRPIYRQNFGSGGSGNVDAAGPTDKTLTTSWVRYTDTVTMPSIAGKTIGTNSSLIIYFLNYQSGTVASNVIDVWGVQLEAGSVATPFQTATGTIQGELAACQRYYYRQGGSQVYQTMGIGWAISTTVAQIRTFFPVQMRTTPTSVDSSTLVFFDQVNAGVATGTLQLVTNQSSPTVGYLTTAGTTGLTQYRSYEIAANNSTSAFLGFSAEL